MMFHDRKDAGEQLAARLPHLKDKNPVVLALPRGGVAIGFEIARVLGAPLDIVLVRKIGVPWQPELALGAVADGGGGPPEIFIDERMAQALAIPLGYVRDETARQLAELERRREIYCAGRAPVEIDGRTAIVVDDGIATGATMRVALRAVRRGADPARLGPRRSGRRRRDPRQPRRRSRRDGLRRGARGARRDRLLLRGFPPDERRRGHRPPGPLFRGRDDAVGWVSEA